MTSRRLKTAVHLVAAVPLLAPLAGHAADRAGDGMIQLAQLSPAEIEAKKKAEQNKQRGNQGPNQGQGQGQGQGGQQPQRRGGPQQQQQGSQQPQQPGQKSFMKPVVPPAPKTVTPNTVPKVITPPNAAPKIVTPQPITPKVITPPNATPKVVTPVNPAPGTGFKKTPEGMPPTKNNPVFLPKGGTGAAGQVPQSTTSVRPGGSVPFVPKAPIASKPITPPQFNSLQQGRQTKMEAGGKRTVIQEGNRTIIKQDNRVFIRHDEAERFRNLQGARTMQLPGGVSQTFYMRPDGYRVITETDRNGHLLRRYRRGPDGREHMIVDNRQFWRRVGIGVGVGALATIVALNMRPPVVSIPRERYIMDYDRASDDDLYQTLIAPPIEPLERAYSLEEVRHNVELRDRVRRIDLDAITFDTASFTVGPEQYGKLERLARMINRVLEQNPESVFLIEGHTDAVGPPEDNLSLSDRRAQSVAQILTEQFGVPPENLTTQGYGEQYLKIPTQGAERGNRRVTVRNVTQLVSQRR